MNPKVWTKAFEKETMEHIDKGYGARDMLTLEKSCLMVS